MGSCISTAPRPRASRSSQFLDPIQSRASSTAPSAAVAASSRGGAVPNSCRSPDDGRAALLASGEAAAASSSQRSSVTDSTGIRRTPAQSVEHKQSAELLPSAHDEQETEPDIAGVRQPEPDSEKEAQTAADPAVSAAPVAVYRLKDEDEEDDDSDSDRDDGCSDDAEDDDSDDASVDADVACMSQITEEQIFAATADSFDDGDSSVEQRRASLIASAPFLLAASGSGFSSPADGQRRLTLQVAAPSFHVLLIDEDEQHAEIIAGWLRRRRCIVTACRDGDEAVQLMDGLLDDCRLQQHRSSSPIPDTAASASNSSSPASALRASRSSPAPRLDGSALVVPELSPKLEDVDLILCDSCMSGAGGQPFLDYAKSSPLISHVPVVLLSAEVESAAVNRAINRGAFDLWRKPVARSLLQNAVRLLRDGKREEQRARLLRQWGDNFKAAMLQERASAITLGHHPATLTSAPLTPTRSGQLLTHKQSSRLSLAFVAKGAAAVAAVSFGEAADGGSSGLYVQLLTSSAAAGSSNCSDDEMEKISDWLRERGVEHSCSCRLRDVKRALDLMGGTDAETLEHRGSRSHPTGSITVPRIAEGNEEAETAEEDRRRAGGGAGVLYGSRGAREAATEAEAEARHIAVLIADMDGIEGTDIGAYHQLLTKATDKGVAIIIMSEEASSLSFPVSVNIDAVLHKPLRKDTFCAKFAGLLQRRHARQRSRALARRAEGYREMVERIRQKKLSTPPASQQHSLLSHGQRDELRLLSFTPPPAAISLSIGDAKAGHSRSRSSTDCLPGDRARTHSDESEERKRAQLTVRRLQSRRREQAKQEQEEHKEAVSHSPLPPAIITR